MNLLQRSLLLATAGLLAPVASGQIYVDKSNTSGPWDGTTWTTAYDELDDALTDSTLSLVGEIWVADGTYQPTIPTDPSDTRTRTFLIPNGVKVYGGFAGSELFLEDRPGNLYTSTVLNGNVARTPDRGDDVYTVVTLETGGDVTFLDGFRIEYGNSDGNAPSFPGTDPRAHGGGIYAVGTSFHLENLTVSSNLADQGAGLYVDGSLGDEPTAIEIVTCTFTGNTAGSRGGGASLYFFAGSVEGQIEQSYIFNSVFSENEAGTNTWVTGANTFVHGGGGIYLDSVDGTLAIQNCLIHDNDVTGAGGGVFLTGNNRMQMVNCTVTGNTSNATSDQAGLNDIAGGAGVFASGNSNPNSYIYNSIVWGNLGNINPADLTGGSTSIGGSSNPLVVAYTNTTYIFYSPGPPVIPAVVHPGVKNLQVSPQFVNPSGQNYNLSSGSLCLDAGDDGKIHDDYPDLDGDSNTSEVTPFDLRPLAREYDDPSVTGAGNAVPSGDDVITDLGALERQIL